MVYRVLLELIVTGHFAFILFIIFGGALGWRWPRTIFVHLSALLYGLLNELLNIKCPLAPFENYLRDASIDSGYVQGLLEPLLLPIIYPPKWNQEFGNFLAIVLLTFNLLVYAFIWQTYRKQMIRN